MVISLPQPIVERHGPHRSDPSSSSGQPAFPIEGASPGFGSERTIQKSVRTRPRPLPPVGPDGTPYRWIFEGIGPALPVTLVESGLSPASVNVQMTAVRRLAMEAADNGLLAAELASGIGRVKGIKRDGTRTGNWLSIQQAETLINAPNISKLKGQRDRAFLALLVGTGLRREEAASLTMEHIQQRDGRWVIVDMRGKGGRVRSVPMPSFAKQAVDLWMTAAGFTSGCVFRPVNKGGEVGGDRMTAQAVFDVVKKYAAEVGMENIAPHDLRRSFAKMAHRGKAPLEQIQISLGHSSIQTTERYPGVRQDFGDAPCDRLGLNFSSRSSI
jgi:site-specific recombinase XerD